MKWYRVMWLLGCCLLTAVAVGAADGVLDTSFHAPDGYVLWDGGAGYDRGRDIALQDDGKIVVAGYMTNGVLDASFGYDGMALYDGGNREECYDLAVQCDDSILLAGHSGYSGIGASDWDLVVLKYNSDGTLDTTFASKGVYSYDPTENTEWGYGLTLQTDGKIVVTGQVHNGSDDDVIVLRLENSPCDANEPNEPSLIYTAEDLNALAARPNEWDKHFKLMADIDLSGYTYDRAVIAPDVDDISWDFEGTPFTGVFDGGGHAVLNLTITGKSYLGLFGRVGPGGQVKGLGVEKVNITGSYQAIGGIVADCFWDTQTSDQTTSAGGEGKTTGQMQTTSTFLDAGWDFVDESENGAEDIWWILEGQGYPRLWWETEGN